MARIQIVLRGQKVMFDADLAALYGVTTRRVKEKNAASIKRVNRMFSMETIAGYHIELCLLSLPNSRFPRTGSPLSRG